MGLQSRSGIVTSLTDFGATDAYVAAMRGVMLGICREATLVDITHSIPPQDITGAAFTLAGAFRFFSLGTVHLVVVDPGVGSDRRSIAVEAGGHLFVAPDNGVLDLALASADAWRAVELSDRSYWRSPQASATFHGRDIFAPVAAHLASGVPLEDLGEPVSSLVRLPWPEPNPLSQGGWRGEVIHVDHFGNLTTNLPGSFVTQDGRTKVTCEGRPLGAVRHTYADVPLGEALALIGSHGMVEIAVRNGNASQRLGVGRGARVEIVG